MNWFIFVFAVFGILVSPCLCATTTVPESNTDTTTEATTAHTTPTPKPTTGPNDLTSTDYIIIGVTCGVFALVLIGGLIYCIRYTRSSQREKDEEYSEYLRRNEMEGIKEGGITNAGFEPNNYPPVYPYNGKMQGFPGNQESGPSYIPMDAASLMKHPQMMQMPGQAPMQMQMQPNPYQMTQGQMLTQVPSAKMTGSVVSQITVPGTVDPTPHQPTVVAPQVVPGLQVPADNTQATAAMLVTSAVVSNVDPTPAKPVEVVATPNQLAAVVPQPEPVKVTEAVAAVHVASAVVADANATQDTTTEVYAVPQKQPSVVSKVEPAVVAAVATVSQPELDSEPTRL